MVRLHTITQYTSEYQDFDNLRQCLEVVKEEITFAIKDGKKLVTDLVLDDVGVHVSTEDTTYIIDSKNLNKDSEGYSKLLLIHNLVLDYKYADRKFNKVKLQDIEIMVDAETNAILSLISGQQAIVVPPHKYVAKEMGIPYSVAKTFMMQQVKSKIDQKE